MQQTSHIADKHVRDPAVDIPVNGIPRTIERVFPDKNHHSSGDNIDGVEKEAIALSGELNSGSIECIRATVSQLQQLAGRAGRVGSRAGQVLGIISAAIAKAQRRIRELESSDGVRISIAEAQEKFNATIYALMPPEAQKLYDSIDDNTKYALVPVNEEGDAVPEAARIVAGKDVKRMMTLIKFHSLNTGQKKQILEETFGEAAAEGEGTPQDAELLAKKKEELLDLYDALDDMEAYKALMLLRKYKPAVAEAMIEQNHNNMVAVREQVDEVVRKYDYAMHHIGDDMALAKLKAAKLNMKERLKKDVIDNVMLEQSSEMALVSAGLDPASTEVQYPGYNATNQGFV